MAPSPPMLAVYRVNTPTDSQSRARFMSRVTIRVAATAPDTRSINKPSRAPNSAPLAAYETP